jgi:hypothetical protein
MPTKNFSRGQKEKNERERERKREREREREEREREREKEGNEYGNWFSRISSAVENPWYAEPKNVDLDV